MAGGTWTSAAYPLLSAGDIDQDGRADLWATTAADTESALLLHVGADTVPTAPVALGTDGRQWILRMA